MHDAQHDELTFEKRTSTCFQIYFEYDSDVRRFWERHPLSAFKTRRVDGMMKNVLST